MHSIFIWWQPKIAKWEIKFIYPVVEEKITHKSKSLLGIWAQATRKLTVSSSDTEPGWGLAGDGMNFSEESGM